MAAEVEIPPLPPEFLKLEGKSDFHTWARSIKSHLIKNDMVGLIDGSLPIEVRQQFDEQLTAWIKGSVAPHIQNRIFPWLRGVAVWEDLYKKLSDVKSLQLSSLLEDLGRITQGNRDIKEYYAEFKPIVDDIMMVKKPALECPVDCEASSQLVRYMESDYVIGFVNGLNDKHAKSLILKMKPLPDLPTAFGYLRQPLPEPEPDHIEGPMIVAVPHQPSPWASVPHDLTLHILHSLGAVMILETVQRMCRTWHQMCADPAMWRVIDFRTDDGLDRRNVILDMCCEAVRRSQGHLEEITLGDFVIDELLIHIAESSPRLRSLRVELPHRLTEAGLVRAVERRPELEELCLFSFDISADTIRSIGHSCPLLRTFTLSHSDTELGDEEATAIAQSMPQLRCLRWWFDNLTNVGLRAILDGCLHLEVLDLRGCQEVDLTGDLKSRCSHISLRHPNEDI